MSSTPDLYAVLGVAREATHAEIRAAYRARARAVHPDASDAPDATLAMAALNEAFAVLGDPVRRAAYDRTLPWVPFAPAAPRRQPDDVRPSPGARPRAPGRSTVTPEIAARVEAAARAAEAERAVRRSRAEGMLFEAERAAAERSAAAAAARARLAAARAAAVEDGEAVGVPGEAGGEGRTRPGGDATGVPRSARLALYVAVLVAATAAAAAAYLISRHGAAAMLRPR